MLQRNLNRMQEFIDQFCKAYGEIYEDNEIEKNEEPARKTKNSKGSWN